MPSILIVDDEPQNLNALKREVGDRNPDWIILTAANEHEATEVLGGNSIDVVITDLVMATDQSGMEVLRNAKARDPFVMVILITAFEKHLDRYKAFELGAFDCVQKNTPGVIAAEEIIVKTQAALRFRQLTARQIADEKRLTFMKRYFDPRVFGVLEQNPELLELRRDTVTICFWDVRGFSKLCDSLKGHPALIADFLKEYFEAAANVIFDRHGVLDKYIGDGVMGLFGALQHREDKGREDAINAVEAALDFRQRFDVLCKKWTAEWTLYTAEKIDIGLGCGIHTGDVLVGNVGPVSRDQYTALGPDVNLAARIESRSTKGQILISASTQARIKEHFETVDAGTIEDIKNIPGKFPLFSVSGKK
ncbi:MULTISPECIES: adenylate/guanylate cyclase domain-containing protein [unclassified Bradyrhizobium]|uniref:adenylate/guanylate cyclase domain-containing protein n=1 Tax=unclassified Bradyrhizobium TaxID=2631580 RepID=UPI001BA73804|nr:MULTISPECIES: adenylate/guanylate cyclase domain-containing protein [unclassified Bradyrhizobium]MBR1201512.1 response regulator [Bradyrhizobium sp. AUGA SZCCT0124]MBR1310668.1 response regulator [Bradyrhizobium sp. AUGA SZCCT0051]MBR1340811.1 response regulator [Bradyrhizobium sp. AUGA SZCCT0105]MBR1355417.1 response regulator [Bradyrhizobium sp. AUGA SZCCT0045]